MKSAGSRIARELDFKRTIRVLVEFTEFDETDTAIGTTTHGPKYIAKQLIGQTKSKEYLVPQSLVKQQAKLPKQYSSDKSDFTIQINTRKNWNFVPNLMEITKDQHDLELVVVHELTHGLGFSSDLECNEHYEYSGEHYLAPRVSRSEDRMSIGFLPVSIYDSLIYSRFGSIGGLCGLLRKFHRPISSKSAFLSKMDCDPEFMAVGLVLFIIATSNDARLIFPDGTDAAVKTVLGSFAKGKSLCHLADTFKSSADFLMTSSATKGTTLNSEMAKYNSTSIYGPKTFKVLETLGWPTRSSPNAIPLIDISSTSLN